MIGERRLIRIESIGVIGAGTMGSGITRSAAVAGLNVVMIDVSDAALRKGRAAIKASLERLASYGKLEEAALARIVTSTDDAGSLRSIWSSKRQPRTSN